MLKKSLLVGALALLALSVGRPAAAQSPVFFEPYGEMFGARTFLWSPEDARPKDARQKQPSRVENPKHRIAVGPFVRDTNRDFLVGGGVAYANTQYEANPWSLNFNYYRFSLDGSDRVFDSYDVVGKLVLWQPREEYWPVASVVARYNNPGDFGDEVYAVLALDQRVTRDVYLTGNIGYADVRGFDFDEQGLFAGIGATWSPACWPRFSLSANYIFDTDTAREDTYSVSGIWTFGRDASLQVGGGKHEKVFGTFVWKWDHR